MTESRFQDQLKKAKDKGYIYIASVVKTHFYTTYWHVESIDDLIANDVTRWPKAPHAIYTFKNGNYGYIKYGSQTSINSKTTILKSYLYSI